MTEARCATLHLFCNAHLDPAWLWEWEDGVAEAITTFRTAAELCEEFPEFIFNHNESLLYELVLEHEPELFRRIQKLVRLGRWKITGGWYLQPDCNIPSGESLVRQIQIGKRFFRRHFGVDVRNGLNVDSFGHSRGLVQILRKSGYDTYFFGRPAKKECALPVDQFRWIGYDGSEIVAGRGPQEGYSTRYGSLVPSLKGRLQQRPMAEVDLFPWGVGDHGGGPSRRDLRELRRFLAAPGSPGRIVHSTAEAFFRDLGHKGGRLPAFRGDLNPHSTGGYTSQIRIKQKHRALENALCSAEKMAAAARLNGLMSDPGSELEPAVKDLLAGEFHDIICGTCIQDAEAAALRRFEHGLEIAERVRLRAFLALTAGERRGQMDNIPVFVFNPHPYPVAGRFECQFMLHDFNWRGTFFDATVRQAGRLIPAQIELERADGNLDWAKHLVVDATLQPGMNRFDCAMKETPRKPPIRLKPSPRGIRFANANLRVFINGRTGLVDSFRVNGKELVGPNAFRPLVVADGLSPWGGLGTAFRKVVGRFTLMNGKDAAQFADVKGPIRPLQVIEDGPARTVVEALLQWHDSKLSLRYYLPKRGTELRLDVRVYWNERSRMLKLSVPLGFAAEAAPGQVAYGVESAPVDGRERLAQQWVAAVSRRVDRALTCVNNGTYGFDCTETELRLSLLRSPAFSGHDGIKQDRFAPRIDQGERRFRFWFNGGRVRERLAAIGAEAQALNEAPYALSYFPPGKGRKARPAVLLSDPAVQLTALKTAQDGKSLLLRLFESTGRKRTVRLSLPVFRRAFSLSLGGFEIKSLVFSPATQRLTAVDLLERPLAHALHRRRLGRRHVPDRRRPPRRDV